MRSLSLPRRAASAALVLMSTVVLALGVQPAAARSHTCATHSGTLAHDSTGRIWHAGHGLFGCTTVYDDPPRSVRLGPWAPFTKVAFDGVDVVWTIRHHVEGFPVDRIWAANVDDPTTWMTGLRAVPAAPTTSGGEALVQKLMVVDQGIAWVTRTSSVVLAVRDPAGEDPALIGTLPTVIKPYGDRLLVGTWDTIPAETLAATAKLQELDGDGDECGGVNPYKLTVQPVAPGPRIGVSWDGNWERARCG